MAGATPTTATASRWQHGQLMTPQDVARAWSMRPETVVEMSRDGILPAIKVGSRWRYIRRDLEAWLDERKRTGTGERP